MKNSRHRAHLLGGIVLLTVVALVGGHYLFLRNAPRGLSQPETAGYASAVSNAVAAVRLVESNAVHLEVLDVRNLDAQAFKAVLSRHAASSRLWMPGEFIWIVADSSSSNRVSLALMMDAFADAGAEVGSAIEVFASYVGTVEEAMPAFENRLSGRVLPQWFVTKSIPEMNWLDTAEVDADIVKRFLEEVRSMQVVRRLVLEGNILSLGLKDRKDEDRAIDCWQRAYVRNPRDPMLLERISNLRRNAEGFLAVGKFLQAMKCWETIVNINPRDASALHNFGLCLKRMGKLDLAERAIKRAAELMK